MIDFDDWKHCVGCSSCAQSCPVKCIDMKADREGFLYPQVNKNTCINCGKCERVCPVKQPVRVEAEDLAFAAQILDETIRKESSSGGVFSAMALEIIERGGVIFGAAWNEKEQVVHIPVETPEDLKKLRGSKYVQSVIGDCYQNAKDYLENGRWVLFSGTACQIAGLYGFLGKEYSNLLTIDVICHGSPSPLSLSSYISSLNIIHDSVVKSISFRNKENSWKHYDVQVVYENGNQMQTRYTDDLYMKSFLSNLSLRPSCYDCHFKGVKRITDITLGDFWGIEKVLPEADDDKGCSLVLINSDKGIGFFEQVRDLLKVVSVDRNTALKYNLAAVTSPRMPEKRTVFFRKLEKSSFEKALRIEQKSTVRQRIGMFKSKIYQLIKR